VSLCLALSRAGSWAGSTESESRFCTEQSSSCVVWPRFSWVTSASDVVCLECGKDGVGAGQGQPLTQLTGVGISTLPPPVPPSLFRYTRNIYFLLLFICIYFQLY